MNGRYVESSRKICVFTSYSPLQLFNQQIRGTTIGTKFAPPYAILFMADLEEKILSASEKKPMIWWRYIDDIFFIWEHGEESLENFLNKLNSLHPTIKFTAEYSKETIYFLDVNIRLVGGGSS